MAVRRAALAVLLAVLIVLGTQRFAAGIVAAPAYGPVRGGGDVARLERGRAALATAHALGGDPRDLGNRAYLGLQLRAAGEDVEMSRIEDDLMTSLSDAPGEPENWLRLAIARAEDVDAAMPLYRLVTHRFGWFESYRTVRVALAWQLWRNLENAERKDVAREMVMMFREKPHAAVDLARRHGATELYRLVLAAEPKQRQRFDRLLRRSPLSSDRS